MKKTVKNCTTNVKNMHPHVVEDAVSSKHSCKCFKLIQVQEK